MPLRILNVTPPPILQDKTLQQELDREGVVTFPFLSADALAALRAFYNSLHPTVPQGPIKNFYVSTHSPMQDYKLEIEQAIQEIITPAVEVHFCNYQIFTSALIIKSASPESELGLHQDWTVVDETQFASYGLWIPLVDVSSENGWLYMLKRSHRLGPTYRHTALPNPYLAIDDVAKKYLTPYSLKAGEAILFNQALLHKSGPNLSQEERPSIVSTIAHQQAVPLMYAPSASSSQLDYFEVDKRYVQHYLSFFEDSKHLPAKALKIGTLNQVDQTPATAEEFEKLYLLLLQQI